MTKRNPHKLHSGFSLVELMVAMVVGLVLLTGVTQIFVGGRASYRLNDGMARLQENGRFISDLLASNIRMAGYQGCLNLDHLEPRIIADNAPDPSDITLDSDKVILGTNNVTAGSTSYGGKAVKGGTDVLILRNASPGAYQLTGNLDADNSNIQVNAQPTEFDQGDVLLITDCSDADIFQASSISSPSGKTTIAHANNINTSNRLSKAYQDDAFVMTFESNTYFVADSGRDNNTGQDIFSLYVHRGDNTTEELIEGVEDMQVQFGEDQTGDGSVDRYVNASAPPDFTKVISVRVGLLLTSGDTATTQPDTATYDVLDETVDPADDRLLRKVFTVTATARNRELRSTAFN